MNNNYQSTPKNVETIYDQLEAKRQKVKMIMRHHNIYDWPLEDEEEFGQWMANEPRLTEKGKQELKSLAHDVELIKKQIALKLKRKK